MTPTPAGSQLRVSFVSAGATEEAACGHSPTKGQWQVNPGGVPAVASHDPRGHGAGSGRGLAPLHTTGLWWGGIEHDTALVAAAFPAHSWGQPSTLAARAQGWWCPFSRLGSGERGMGQMTRLPCGWGLSGLPWAVQLWLERCARPCLRPHLCVQADTGSRRRWPENGRLQCLWGDRAGPDTHPRPPHSAAPQSPAGEHSGSLRVWRCRSPGCDRAGIDTRLVPLSSSVHCGRVHTVRQRKVRQGTSK